MELEPRLKSPRKVFLRHPSAIFLWNVFNKVRPYTCVMYDGLFQMKKIIDDLDEKSIEGNIVEVGCWRGGCSAFMAWVNKRNGKIRRTTFLLDSFEGLFSALVSEDLAHLNKYDLQPATVEIAKEVLKKLDVEDRAQIIKGFVQDTIPQSKDRIGKIAVLRLDVDIYEPTKFALEALYDSVLPGGYIVLDDYELAGERKAVDEFRSKRGITSPILKDTALYKEYWIK